LSSILKALKKLERNPPDQDLYQPWSEQIDHKEVVTGRVKKNWRAVKLLRSVLLVLLLAAVGWLGFSQRQRIFQLISTAKIFESQPDTGSGAAAPRKPTTNDQTIAKPIQPAPTTKATAGRYAQAETRTPSPQTKGLPPPPRDPGSTARDSAIAAPKPQTSVSRPALPPQDAAASPPSKSSKKPLLRAKAQDSLASLSQSSLKLQAIAWSDDVQRRLAVINGRILREGGSVDGFVIKQIRRDDVVVSDGKESWKLEFGLQN
jgi:hypothetical protein